MAIAFRAPTFDDSGIRLLKELRPVRVCSLGTVLSFVAAVLMPRVACADIRRNPGDTVPLPTQKYVRVISEVDSPVQRAYIKSKDGIYIAAAIRKPKGQGRFPAIIMFHGAPGGRGIDQLVGWSTGSTGGPVWERFLREGYVVVVADYRGGDFNATSVPSTTVTGTAIDDGLAVVDHVKALFYVDASRIHLYGVSLGGNLVLHLISKVPTIKAAVLGAPAPLWFLGITVPTGPPNAEWFALKPDPKITARNIAPVKTAILIIAGTADRLLGMDIVLHDALAAAGKSVRMEVYEGGYHDFVLGPQGQLRPDLPQDLKGEPLFASALDALEKSVQFVRGQ